MAQVGVFMEFHDRGLPLPHPLDSATPGNRSVPCFRDGEVARDLPQNRGCLPGIFSAEGRNADDGSLMRRPATAVTGVAVPTFMLDSGFIGRRLIPYIEEPCQAVRDFDAVIMPHLRRQAEAQRGGQPVSDRVAQGWTGQELQRIRTSFDCDGDGHLRDDWREAWKATTFRVHLYDARGEVVTTLEVVPNWVVQRGDWVVPARWPNSADTIRWLSSQFPEADRAPASAQ
ncbi:hypothetical protein GXW78_19950 [Roseomonas terrae]|uniref:Uncharacterized protein n=1 Tax=Neoroseomonas terrae TaxID=424799 RepID=A0ABS5ELR2_9PROT|nr:hypothetical protein [Neoroseomonas terrae]MBR0651949.1 hypothetical protein [Neoroseomonas terrae]